MWDIMMENSYIMQGSAVFHREHGVEMEQWELEPSLEIIIDKLHSINDSRLFGI